MLHTRPMLQRLATALALLGCIMTAIGPAMTAAAAWQEAEVEFEPEDEVVEIAAPPVLEPAWSVVGRGESTDDSVTAAGWLTAVNGLQAGELAPTVGDSADTGTATTSRFTFVADIGVTSTVNRGSVTTTLGQGTLTVYLDADPLPSPADLESFRSNLVVAVYDAGFQGSVLADSGPAGQAVVSGRMTLTQTEALSFELGDEVFRFGHADAELELTLTGGVIPGSDDETTIASYFGTARVTARSANPMGTGQATVAELSECEQMLAWTEATRNRLVTAGELRASILNEGQLITPDPAEAFATISTLLDEQRTDIGPEGTEEAARLALAVLNTDARGLELLSTALDTGNEPAVTQAMTVLADGDALATRALSLVDEITPTCEPDA